MSLLHSLSSSIHKAMYIQTTDPGAVGAKVMWVDTTAAPFPVKRRNDGDSGWDILGYLPSDSGIAPSDATYITKTANGTLSNEFAMGSLGTGIVKNTTTTGVPSIATASDISAPTFGADAGSNDIYVVTLTPALASYVVGTHLRFFANTANIGAASVNFNGLGALTIVKVSGGITTGLATNDIRAGQWVDGVIAAGSNFQIQSTLGAVKTYLVVFEFGDGKNSSSLEANQLTRVPYLPAAGTIVRARIESDATGSAVVNIKKSTADPPSYTGICASAKPTLSSDIYNDDTTLTGWTLGVAAGDALLAELESVTTCKQVTVVLEVLKA